MIAHKMINIYIMLHGLSKWLSHIGHYTPNKSIEYVPDMSHWICNQQEYLEFQV